MTENVHDEARDEIVSQAVDDQGRQHDDVDVRDLPPVDSATLDRLDEPT
ncbi:MAG TPA: hypothetical protein VM429_03200 [Micropruina sp.]|jgi:hypothetical protein|nr:hypothetical protein [Micropruina sp.]